MWVSMQVSIYMYVSLELPFWGEGLSEALYPQMWSKCIFKSLDTVGRLPSLITLGAHAQRGYSSWVCVSVCVSVTPPMFVRLTNDTTYLVGNEGQKTRVVFSTNWQA